jgi:hypothetical protein
MAFTETSNRGMSLFPSNYGQAWNAYNPNQQQGGGGLTGKAARNANAAENMAYAQGGGAGGTMGMLQQLLGGQGGGGGGYGASATPYRRAGQGNRFGTGAPGTKINYPAQGGGGQAGGGAGGIPAATTNPQTPVATNPLAGLAEQLPGVTSGQLSNDAISQALASLTGAGTGAYSGGSFGDLMRMNTQRAAGEMQRAGAEQQADMQQAFEVARSNNGLQRMQLGSDINRESVMNSVMQRNNIFDLLRGVVGGLI